MAVSVKTAIFIMIANAEAITGWMNTTELQWLANAAKNANYILEFGCYQGRSTRALADNTNGVVFAVDPWGLPYYNDDGSQASWIDTRIAFKAFNENLRDHIDTGRVVPIQTYSWEFVSQIKFDLIFIDGDHRYKYVKEDIIKSKEMIKNHGVIAGHDYGRSDWPGVQKAVDELFEGCGIKINETIWSVEVNQ